LTINKARYTLSWAPTAPEEHLANTLLGHPKVQGDEGDILIDGQSLVDLSPNRG